MMAASNGEEPPNSSMGANISPVPMAAKLMVATDRGECQQLKDLTVKEETETMVVAMAPAATLVLKNQENRLTSTSTGDMDAEVMIATSPRDCGFLKDTLNKKDVATMFGVMSYKKEDIPPKPSVASMNPMLLLLSSQGNCNDLRYFLNKEATPATQASRNVLERDSPGDGSSTTVPTEQASVAAEDEGASHPAHSAESRLDLEGVTIHGDTALHVVANCGDGSNFLRSAEIIYNMAKQLLLAQNNKGDTPLHCAVRAGNSQMASCLIDLAATEDNAAGSSRLKQLLSKENCRKETALHDAIRIGNKGIITKLLEFDPELAKLPIDGMGTSPLYLAVLLERVDIAKLLHQKSQGNLSYSGPCRQNALHAAVLRSKEMTEILLSWNKHLAEQADQDGSRPLHFAASLRQSVKKWMASTPLIPVLLASPIQLYQPDSQGCYPIHVAASSGAKTTVSYFIKERPEIAGFRDSNGRTFLHVAVERGYLSIVAYACLTPSLDWILNMQDNDGNTAMHVVLQRGNKYIFCYLLQNREVNINIPNNKGQTPLDIAQSKIPAGFHYGWNPEALMLRSLTVCKARGGCRRVDHFQEQYITKQKQEHEVRESEKLTNSTQTLGIGSVLIVTVTFGAMFALPGGYRADDHYNGGTPTLARRYIFDAFVMANAIAFICSALATINLMYSGMAMVSLPLRRRHFNISLLLAFSSVTSLGAAFALGMFSVLAPVARWTATAICVMIMIASLCLFTEPLHGLRVAIALYVRTGNQTMLLLARVLLTGTLITYWPCVVIFGWAAISTKYGHRRHG